MLVIGDYAVGKTSLIKRFCEGYFTPNYKLTIGVDFAVKDMEVDGQKVTLQVSSDNFAVLAKRPCSDEFSLCNESLIMLCSMVDQTSCSVLIMCSNFLTSVAHHFLALGCCRA